MYVNTFVVFGAAAGAGEAIDDGGLAGKCEKC